MELSVPAGLVHEAVQKLLRENPSDSQLGPALLEKVDDLFESNRDMADNYSRQATARMILEVYRKAMAARQEVEAPAIAARPEAKTAVHPVAADTLIAQQLRGEILADAAAHEEDMLTEEETEEAAIPHWQSHRNSH